MKIYLVTSDQYSHLLPAYSFFFNKYWTNQQVTILCYDIPKMPLPDNFEILSIGKQKENLSPLVNYFQNVCQEKYFVMLLEDLFLVDHVDVSKVARLEEEMKKGAHKASFHFYNANDVIDAGNGIVEFKQRALYRTNVQAAIWNRSYLLRHLHPDNNWWTFETQHQYTMDDGGKLVFLKEQITPHAIFDAINIYYKGGRMATNEFSVKTDLTGNGLTHEEDVEILKKFLIGESK